MTRIGVRLTPRSTHEAIELDGDALRVRVTAPPADGRANVALERLLAERLGIPRTAVHIVVGRSSRQKIVEIDGLDEVQIRSRLGGTAPAG
jgi:uncharacterized protein (TIGR00251 family)